MASLKKPPMPHEYTILELSRVGSSLNCSKLEIYYKNQETLNCFLNENKNKKKAVIDRLKRRCRLVEACIVDPKGRSGGIGVWWCKEVRMEVLFC